MMGLIPIMERSVNRGWLRGRGVREISKEKQIFWAILSSVYVQYPLCSTHIRSSWFFFLKKSSGKSCCEMRFADAQIASDTKCLGCGQLALTRGSWSDGMESGETVRMGCSMHFSGLRGSASWIRGLGGVSKY